MSLQVQSVPPPSAFGVKFYKCAKVHQRNCLSAAHFIYLHFTQYMSFDDKYNYIWSNLYSSCSIMWCLGESWHWSSSADILPADTQHGPSGWHQPVPGGYPWLNFWSSALKKWRQGGGERLPNVCYWFTVWYVMQSECLKRSFYLNFLHAVSTINNIVLIFLL